MSSCHRKRKNLVYAKSTQISDSHSNYRKVHWPVLCASHSWHILVSLGNILRFEWNWRAHPFVHHGSSNDGITQGRCHVMSVLSWWLVVRCHSKNKRVRRVLCTASPDTSNVLTSASHDVTTLHSCCQVNPWTWQPGPKETQQQFINSALFSSRWKVSQSLPDTKENACCPWQCVSVPSCSVFLQWNQ